MRITLGVVLVGCLVADAGCGNKDAPGGSGPASASGGSALVAPATPVATIVGPSITPTVTSSITFATPKDPAASWFELAYPCYVAAVSLDAGSKASDMWAQIGVAPALAAAGIDADHDIAAIGGWSCGTGQCVYAAVTLHHPERIADMLKTIPGATPVEVGPSHWKFDAEGVKGPRTIHVRTIPIQWGQALPADDWSTREAKATHLVIFTGVTGGPDVDPLAALADPAAAKARVKDVEHVLVDARERCAIGWFGANEWRPGFTLDHARFAIAAPSNGGDAMTKLLESQRTIDVELDATLSPAPGEADYARWYDEARAYLRDLVTPIKAQFGGGPRLDAMFDLFAVVGTQGLQHTIDGKELVLSWRTDRVKPEELTDVEKELEQAGVVP